MTERFTLEFSEGNPSALKTLISSFQVKKSDMVTIITPMRMRKKDGPASATFVVGEDTELFSMNAAACYLLNIQESVEIDQWLEWETTQLNPLVYISIVNMLSKKEEPSIRSGLTACLQKLESSFLGSQQILYPIIWASLFPLLHCKVLPDFNSSFPKIQKWFTELSAHPDYSRAVKAVYTQDISAELKESLSKQPLPVLDISKAAAPLAALQTGPTEEEKKRAYDAWFGNSSQPLEERHHPILPKEGKRNVLITSALPYVNNVPHLGNIIGCVLSADVFSRFCRLRGYNSLYVCGTDEYGTATETKAVEEGLTPEQICDKYYALHDEVYQWFNIDFDFFGRTTTQHQTKVSQDIFWKLHKNGYIFSEAVQQLRCDNCSRFLADRFAEGTCPLCGYDDARGDQCDKCGKLINAVELIKPRCKLCKSSPVVKSSHHLFIDLPQLVSPLTQYLDKQFEEGTWTHNAKLITKAWLRDGIKARCITRDLKWGTPVPLEGFTDKVFYVWFDAPIGYISITANYTDHWEKWWKNPQQVELYNFMAKDNVPFHSVVFPCTEIGANDNYTLVNHLCATEYLNYEDDKFSKSRGVGVFGTDAKTTGIPADIWRFYLLYVRPESQDSSFSWDDFLLKNNSELLNNLGNFVNRALKFVADSYDRVVPDIEVTDTDLVLFAQITTELTAYIDKLEKAQLRDGIWHVLTISRLGNQYFQSTTPWKLAKSSDGADKTRAASVVGIAANVACLLSLLINPYMPTVSDTMREQLSFHTSCKLNKSFICLLKPGHKIGTPSPLFAKIDSALITDLKKRFAGTQATRPGSGGKTAAEVKAQEVKVKELQKKGLDKSLIDKEIAKLVQLQAHLSLSKGDTVANEKTNEKGASSDKDVSGEPVIVDSAQVEKLTKEVEVQGSKVRELKNNKVEKSEIDAAVRYLLQLKRQLAFAEGKDPDAKPAKSKGKKK